MRVEPSRAVLFLLLGMMAGSVDAQGRAPGSRWMLGIGASILATSDRNGPTMGLSGAIGLEKYLGPQVSARMVFEGTRTVRTRSGGFVCSATGDCPIPVFPDAMLSGELHGLVSLRQSLPVRLIGGAGITIPLGGRENWRGAHRADSSAGIRATLRGGLEISLGKRLRASRIQLTRSAYTKSIFSMDWLDALVILFPL